MNHTVHRQRLIIGTMAMHLVEDRVCFFVFTQAHIYNRQQRHDFLRAIPLSGPVQQSILRKGHVSQGKHAAKPAVEDVQGYLKR